MESTPFLPRLKSLAAALTTAQAASIGMAFLLVIAVVGGSAYWLNSTSYRLLFSEMDPEGAADVIARLKAEKVQYQLDEGGRSIRVPADRVDDLRLEFAGQGMPSSGRMGFELFDRTVFGATEFQEQVNYGRALEGELARTISTLSEVSAARVHIALAKESPFGDRQQPAKASVVLKLRNRTRSLPASTASAIASLMAASVEGLRPESVVVIDNFGRPLFRPAEGDGPMDAAQMEHQQRLERDLSSRVVALLEPVFGLGRVRANVAVRLNASSQEETQELWDPAAAAIRSRQTNTDGTSATAVAMGIAGARSNLPAPAAPAQAASQPPAAPAQAAAQPAAPANASSPASTPSPAAAATVAATAPAGVAPLLTPGLTRVADTTNYEISRTTRRTVRPGGEIARLSVAVLVDHEQVITHGKDGRIARQSKPRTPADLQKIQGVVATAVGFDQVRGDQLTVENIPFDEPITDEPVAPPAWQRYVPQMLDAARIGAVVLLGLLAFLFVIRPVVRKGLRPAAPGVLTAGTLPQQLPRTVEELQGELEATLENAERSSQPNKMTALTKRLTTITQKEPEHAAQLIRAWLTEEGGR